MNGSTSSSYHRQSRSICRGAITLLSGALAAGLAFSAASAVESTPVPGSTAGGPVTFAITTKVTENGTAEVATMDGALTVSDKLDAKVARHQWVLGRINPMEKHKVHVELDKRPDMKANVVLLLNYSDRNGGKSAYAWTLNLKNGRATPRNALSGTAFVMAKNDKGFIFDASTQSVAEKGVLRVILAPVAGPAQTGTAVIRKLSIDKSL